jgi:hypothetical protein
MTVSSELLTFAQAAQRLGIGVLDIRRIVRAEQIPVVRDGRASADPGPSTRNPPTTRAHQLRKPGLGIIRERQ